MSQPKLTAVLYTPNSYKASVGVLVSQNDGEEFKSIVEVRQMSDSNCYEYSFEGGVSNGITRLDANEMWEVAADHYGAMLVPVDDRFMKEHFKEFMKPYLKDRALSRKIARESKKSKSTGTIYTVR
ncbi:conserved hypothetical protein [Vibrio phage 501E54-1]|nr:conserved hypothetical protein [Vibrio phage 501E54-1]